MAGRYRSEARPGAAVYTPTLADPLIAKKLPVYQFSEFGSVDALLKNFEVLGQLVGEEKKVQEVLAADRAVLANAAKMDRLKPEQAEEIAVRDFTGAATVESVETITAPYQKGYDYFGELPVYRVNFANWKGTRIYVSPDTGDIRLRRNFDKSVFDFFWTLHMFGYVSHNINANPGLIAVGAFSMISLLSGIALYIPYMKRKFAKRRQ